MKKITLLFVIMSLVVMNVSAKESGYSISAAVVGMSMDYREYDDAGKILDSEKSKFNEILGGEIDIVYTSVLESENYAQLGLDINYLNGETEYLGAYIDSGLGYGSLVSRTKNTIFDIEVDYMFTLIYKSGFEFAYGFGLGYREWKRELSPQQIEIYSWYSVRPKMSFAYSLLDLQLAALVEYQYGFTTTMSISNPDLRLNLNGSNIVRVTVPLTYSITSSFDIYVAYVLEQQVIGKSDSEYFSDGINLYKIWEPDSTANNQYTKFGMTFKF